MKALRPDPQNSKSMHEIGVQLLNRYKAMLSWPFITRKILPYSALGAVLFAVPYTYFFDSTLNFDLLTTDPVAAGRSVATGESKEETNTNAKFLGSLALSGFIPSPSLQVYLESAYIRQKIYKLSSSGSCSIPYLRSTLGISPAGTHSVPPKFTIRFVKDERFQDVALLRFTTKSNPFVGLECQRQVLSRIASSYTQLPKIFAQQRQSRLYKAMDARMSELEKATDLDTSKLNQLTLKLRSVPKARIQAIDSELAEVGLSKTKELLLSAQKKSLMCSMLASCTNPNLVAKEIVALNSPVNLRLLKQLSQLQAQLKAAELKKDAVAIQNYITLQNTLSSRIRKDLPTLFSSINYAIPGETALKELYEAALQYQASQNAISTYNAIANNLTKERVLLTQNLPSYEKIENTVTQQVDGLASLSKAKALIAYDSDKDFELWQIVQPPQFKKALVRTLIINWFIISFGIATLVILLLPLILYARRLEDG